MKKVILSFFIAISVINVNYAKSQETYLCIASKATGFLFDAKRRVWKNSNFNVENEKKIVEKINGSWQGHNFNLKVPFPSPCTEALTGTVMCTFSKYPILTFKFNIKTMRYIYSDIGSYDDGDTDGAPYIEIGTCTPINFKS